MKSSYIGPLIYYDKILTIVHRAGHFVQIYTQNAIFKFRRTKLGICIGREINVSGNTPVIKSVPVIMRILLLIGDLFIARN